MARLTNLSRAINTLVLLGSMGIATSIGIVYADSSENLTDDDKTMIMRGKPANIPFGVGGLNVPPLVMITMGREHNLFTEAYSDYTDLDGDGKLEIMFDPSFDYYGLFDNKYCYKYVDTSDGFENLTNAPTQGIVQDKGGNSYKKFPGYWIPVREADTKENVSLKMWADTAKPTRDVKYCDGASGEWSGNFLSYATSSRIDVIRKVLYGGARVYSSTKGADLRSGEAKTTKYKNKYSLLTHSRIVRDSHAWGKVLSDLMYEQKLTVRDFAGVSSNTGSSEDAWYFLVASPDSGNTKHNDKTDNDTFTNTMRWSPSYLRYGLVKNSGMPGRAPTVDNPAYIWDWASRQTNSNNNDAIGSTQQKRIDRSKKAEGSKTTNVNLFTGEVQTKGIAVVACTDEFHDLDSCYNYGTEANPIWQPSGLLQQYGQGDSPRMKFGLLSGSWQNNIKGGTLRANIGDFSKEIFTESNNDHFAGDFNFKTLSESNCSGSDTICGIVASLDRFNIAAKEGGWNGDPNGGGVYNSCSRSYNNLKDMANEKGGLCHDWGNPVGEMLYQTVRYFKHNDLTNQDTGYEEAELKIGHVDAIDPYPDGSPEYCAKPYALVIADENISFDSTEKDKNAYGGDTTAVENETGAVSNESGFKSGYYFMGGMKGGFKKNDPLAMYEFIPSKKYVTNLNQIVGLAPAVAFSFGSYNVAGVASLYSRNTLRVTKGPNDNEKALNLQTFVVAMKPNLPQINIPITLSDSSGKQYTKTVEILPFAKSVSGDSSTCKKGIDYKDDPINRLDRIVQSTNQVADFYVESLGDNEGVFRISYEDFEYGSDYDMDWVVGYKYQVLQGSDGNTYVHIMLTHEDGDPYAPQHAGYVITGVENEGVYVDLGKLSAGNDKACKSLLYELDTIINDASIDSCKNKDHWGKITDDGSSGLTQVANSGKDGEGGDACLFPSWDYQEPNYQGFWTSSNIANYYNTFIKPHAQIYYGNRRTLFNLGYTQYAKFGDFNGGANSYRLHGDQDSSMGKVAKTNGTTVTSSRVFRVDENNTESGWLKSPLWYAAKYGINASQKPTRSNPNIEPDNYYLVTNPLKLRDGIAEMLSKMEESLSSGSSFIIAKTPENSDTKNDPNSKYVYSTMYDAGTWYGSLRKTTFDQNYQFEIIDGVGWNAADQFAKLSPEERLIVTADMDADTPKLVRLYAEEIPYERDSSNNYKTAASGKGLLANAGYNVFRKLINENISDEAIDASSDYQVFVDKLVRWLAGDDKYEGINDTANQKIDFAFLNETPLRPRERNNKHFVLGDIINSDATAFKLDCKLNPDTNRESCKQFIAVGANDGMLHILDDLNGKPIISYVPTVMLPSLMELVRETYQTKAHIPFVDSTPKVYYDKIFIKASATETESQITNTYLYGTYGLGFKGGYVLNVSSVANLASIQDPKARMAALSDDFLLWEISDHDSDYIGKQRKAPALLSLANKNSDLYPSFPFLVFGSGYNHTSDNAGLVIVDMLGKRYSECGSTAKYRPCIVNEIDIPAEDPWKDLYGEGSTSRKNVLSPISDYTSTLLDEYAKATQALYYEAMYFGDLYGNVWKMDMNSLGEDATEAKLWGTTDGSKPKVIFKAMDASHKAQPITTQIATSYHKSGGIGLLFGTGALWSEADQGLPSKYYNDTQSVYMIRDLNGNQPEVNASNISSSDNMVRRCDNYSDAISPRCLFPLQESVLTDKNGNQKIKLSRSPSIKSVPKRVYGWYFDLNGFSENDQGLARIYTDPIIKSTEEMVITVNVPNVGDSCEGGGHSYIMRGKWAINPYNIKNESTVKINSLSNETTLELDDEGRLTDNTQMSKANENGPTGNTSETSPTKVSKNASWLRLY